MKTEREMFEAWAKPRKYVLIGATVDGVFSYLNQKTSIAWDSWQASTSRKGYKLVSCEISDDIESAMISSVARGEMPCDIYKAMIGVSE